MKAKPQKMGNPGKFGAVAGKHGKAPIAGKSSLKQLDKPTVGSAMGILGKHYK